MSRTIARQTGTFLAMPWAIFIAAFLYYTLLAIIVVGGADLSPSAVGGAYALPVVAYVGTLLVRAIGALASLRFVVLPAPLVPARPAQAGA